MLKKNKKNLLLAGGLLGALAVSTAASIALSSCSTTSSSTTPVETEADYTNVINWDDSASLSGLTKDEQGLYYSDESKTNVIGLNPSSGVTTITIPATVTTISGYVKVTGSGNNQTSTQTGAFQGITSITTITVAAGSKLTTIGKLAFSGCTGLTGLSDTSNLTSIGTSAFEGCTSLKSFSLSKIQKIWASAFKGCTAFSGAIDLSSVYTIGDNAFNGCTAITSVTASTNNKLTTIGGNAFNGCTELTKVTVPAENISKLKTIGGSSFSGCTKLTTFGPEGTAAGSLVTTTSMGVVGSNAFANTPITTVNASKFTVTPTKYSGDGKTLYGTGSTGSFKNMHHVTSFTLPEGIQRLPSDSNGEGYFSGVGDQSTGFDLVLPSSVVDFFVWTNSNGTSILSAPFNKSGVKSIDASKIAGYDVSNTGRMTVGSFYGATKLESVILKPNTKNIANFAFQNCSSLKWVKNPTSANDTTALTTNGFTAGTTVTSIGTGAFAGAFAESANATVDLSEMTFTNVPAGLFNGSKVKTLKLPSTITTIPAYSFNNMTNLSDVNFAELTDLTSIAGNNFTNTQLTTIDLSNITGSLSFTGVSSSAPLFTGLPTECVVSLPNTMSSFSGVFMSTSGSPVAFNFPKGLALSGGFSTVTDGVLTFTSGNQQASNLRSADLAANTTVTSIGTNTFFGNTKLTNLTLSAKSLNTSSVLFTGGSITAGTSNTSTPSSYTTANVPFGNNTALTNLNYANFASTGTTTSTSAQALFETTSADTWNAVAKIVNSLSNYSYVQSDATTSGGTKLPTNLSTWAAESNTSRTSKILEDSVITTSSGSNGKLSSIVFNNCFSASGSSGIGNITIGATLASNTFIHNGILWTYINNGSSITLTGQANMYKVTSSGTSYLTFFNTQQVQAQVGSNESVTYNIPNQNKVTVSLVIATKATA